MHVALMKVSTELAPSVQLLLLGVFSVHTVLCIVDHHVQDNTALVWPTSPTSLVL